MVDRRMQRVAGSLAAFAVAAGFVAAAVPGTAAAAPGTITWTDGNSKFTRTVSNVNPVVGDIVTVTTTFERTGIPVEYIYSVKDLHPACLTPVPGSARMGGDQVDLDTSSSDWVRAEFGITKYPVYPNINPKSQTFEVQYKVGVNCARDTPLTTSMHYGGSLGDGTYQGKGPNITVSSDALSSTALADVTGAQTGKAVTLEATVTPAAAGGTVQFKAGDNILGDIPVNASGKASIVWTPGAAGSYTIGATFSGRAGVAGSVTTKVVTVTDQPTDPGPTKPGTGSFGF
ncbi:Ig-like domain-containing protein [Nocardia huaxiensis]|uniref:Ig-like domain repeat protein n=1 Tax=Nocardia huaxiensis TaxID=2755382 RepID=A0A7D6VLD7_9NOCA|nr:Ig-like domain-containing protein [Nocardia huaxiensis]QLY32456.1 Ig-like domain repeat protein [Nocardia huaxiensis]UFS93838.1 Ig-like domain-containing protein [Nocardia huaxiensis]